MIFLVLSGKIMFLFPKNMILHLRRKMKDHLCQNNTRKYDILFKFQTSNYLLQRWPFQKGLRWEMIFLVLSEKMVFFFPKTWYFFPWAGSERWPFSRNTWKYDIFCVHVRVLQTWCHAPLPRKIKDGLIPQKYT